MCVKKDKVLVRPKLLRRYKSNVTQRLNVGIFNKSEGLSKFDIVKKFSERINSKIKHILCQVSSINSAIEANGPTIISLLITTIIHNDNIDSIRPNKKQ